MNCHIYNRGLAGAVTDGFIDAMEECIFELEPAKLFINIGSIDIAAGPGYLDKRQRDAMFAAHTNENIRKANKAKENLAKESGFDFIDVNNGLTDEAGNLKKEFSIDGIHLWPNGYAVYLKILNLIIEDDFP